jgi:hypothetical protein
VFSRRGLRRSPAENNARRNGTMRKRFCVAGIAAIILAYHRNVDEMGISTMSNGFPPVHRDRARDALAVARAGRTVHELAPVMR